MVDREILSAIMVEDQSVVEVVRSGDWKLVSDGHRRLVLEVNIQRRMTVIVKDGGRMAEE